MNTHEQESAAQLAFRVVKLEDALEHWRSWAQFVYLGGGPVTKPDNELRAGVNARHDKDVLDVRAELSAVLCDPSRVNPSDDAASLHWQLDNALRRVAILEAALKRARGGDASPVPRETHK